jgi:hypothetical protein
MVMALMTTKIASRSRIALGLKLGLVNAVGCACIYKFPLDNDPSICEPF